MRELGQLFWAFCRIGGLTFGGGYAMLPLMQKEIVEKRKWATAAEMTDYYAVAQSLPGLIAINTATFLGYDRRGPVGAIAATMGMVFPSLVIITLIASFIPQANNVAMVQHALAGIRIAVTALIVWAVVKMWRAAVTNWIGALLFTISLVVLSVAHLSPIFIIAAGAIIGIWQGRRAQAQVAGARAAKRVSKVSAGEAVK